MGGAYEVPGNITPTAEFNFFMDPEAAQIVLDCGLRPVLVGLDVCHQTQLSHSQIAAADSRPRSASSSSAPAPRGCRRRDEDGPHLYDSLAMAAAIRPELLTLEPALRLDRPAGTSTAWLPGRPSAWSRPDRADNALVATAVDVASFEAMFDERVLAHF